MVPLIPLANRRWPLDTNMVEGINNTIKDIKCMAYRFRNDANVFLKLRAAFAGTGR
jgi:transposase